MHISDKLIYDNWVQLYVKEDQASLHSVFKKKNVNSMQTYILGSVQVLRGLGAIVNQMGSLQCATQPVAGEQMWNCQTSSE